MSGLKIIMTGGGTAGHVTPNLALIPKLVEKGFEIQYIGGTDGVEKEIVTKNNIKYHGIATGKLRRYFDVKNFTDPFKVGKGILEARRILKEEKPDVVFSKGGFVAVPVVLAAHLNKIPVVAHESDITPGLANKLSLPYCSRICVTFPETLNHISDEKGILTGTPIRKELFEGSRIKGMKLCDFTDEKPIVLFIGGSLGSKVINEALRSVVDTLTEKYQIIHICGKNNLDPSINNPDYKQFDYVSEELSDLLASADMIVSRAGANVIYELLALRKPNLLIPLSRKSSRGDQILNANSFEKNGYSLVLEEESLTGETLLENIEKLHNDSAKYIKNMENSELRNAIDKIVEIIYEEARNHNR